MLTYLLLCIRYRHRQTWVKIHLTDITVLTGDPGGLEIGLQISHLQQACACHTVCPFSILYHIFIIESYTQ